MQTTDPDSRLQVVVGVVADKKNRYLIQQRPEGKVCAGLWEFPGGKIEQGESAELALVRELKEELDITIRNPQYLTEIHYNYDHARVALSVFLVREYEGVPKSLENQVYDWVQKSDISKRDVLEAVFPILKLL